MAAQFSHLNDPIFRPTSSSSFNDPAARLDSATPAYSPLPEGRQVHFASPAFSPARASGVQTADDDEPVESSSTTNGVLLSFNIARNRVGFFAYDDDTERLLFLPDAEDSSEWSLVKQVIEELRPSQLITSSEIEPDLIKVVEDALSNLPASDGSVSNESSSTAAKLEMRSPREFSAAQGQNALLRVCFVETDEMPASLEAPSDSLTDKERRDRSVRLQSYFSCLTDNALALGCASVVLSHLQAERGPEHMLFRNLQLIQLSKVMVINGDCLRSLQIFSDVGHANMFSSKTKEGLSLFGIMNVARTYMGKRLMHNYFVRPSLDLQLITQRQDAVSCFIRPENQHAADKIRSDMTSIKNVAVAFKALSSGRGQLRDWSSLVSFLYATVFIHGSLLTIVGRKEVAAVERFIQVCNPALFQDVADQINEIIDWDESKNAAGKLVVKPRVDAELDNLRHLFDGLDSFLSRVASIIRSEVPERMTSSLTVEYFAQMGYLIGIPFEGQPPDPTTHGLHDWVFQYHTENFAYYKNDKCRDMDSSLGDIDSHIADLEIEIVQALLDKVLEHRATIVNIVELIAEIDVLLAFAELAQAYNWTRPNMTEEPVVKIKRGRHPLVELCVDVFVPNDFCLVGGQGEGVKADYDPRADYLDPDLGILVVTGSNFSGKSVLLKQVALTVFLAHIGSFVPAEDSLIGLTDRILTRVSTKESVSLGCSAFQIDLNQVSFALRNASPRSLLVIDEFGKGADPRDGTGLFAAVIEHLIKRGPDCPRTLVATHFQEVFRNEVVSSDLPIGLAHMEIALRPPPTRDPRLPVKADEVAPVEQVTYLYQMRKGLANDSHAAACAALFGIDDAVVSRATAVTRMLDSFTIEALMNEPLTDEEKKRQQEDERVASGLVHLVKNVLQLNNSQQTSLDAEAIRDALRQILQTASDG